MPVPAITHFSLLEQQTLLLAKKNIQMTIVFCDQIMLQHDMHRSRDKTRRGLEAGAQLD